MTKLEIVIPCFNESKSLELLVDNCLQIVEESKNKIHFVIVNNGSSDNTEEILNTYSNKLVGIRFLNISPNRGYGGGILAGLEITRAPLVGWTHADLQTPLKDCLHALSLFTEEVMMVKGIRINRKPVDKIFSLGMGLLESIIFRTQLVEINAQPTLFSRQFFDSWESAPEDFSLDLYALVMAKKSDMKVTRFNVSFLERKFGHSKWNDGLRSRFRFIIRTLKYSVKLKKVLS